VEVETGKTGVVKAKEKREVRREIKRKEKEER